jgi:hypothetical protein
MSLFLQYQLGQALGDLGGGDAGAWSGADAAGAGFGLGMGLLMPPLIWRSLGAGRPAPWGPPGATGAPVPGAPVPGPPVPRYCGHCGAPLVAAAHFCGHCGTAAWR